MTSEEHSAFARAVEERLRRDFPDLRCAVRPHVDTHTDEPIALLVFEVQATTPPLQLPYTIIGNETYGASELENLAIQIGTMLSQRVGATRR